MKIQIKIVLLLLVVFITFTLIFSGFIYFSISQYSFADFYKRLEIRAATTAKVELDYQKNTASIKELKSEYLEKLTNEQDYIFEITPATALEKEASNIKVPASFIKEIISNGTGNYQRGNTFFAGIKYKSDEKLYAVIVSAENYYTTHHIAYLRNVLVTLILVSVLFILLASFWVSKKIIKPIQQITNKVKKISSENLSLRLSLPSQNDEFANLARTFNDMLDRLQTSFETQNNFVSNASHEFNTPLTSIIGQADVTLSKSRTQEEYVESLTTILQEAEKLDKKVQALLFLAQTGFNGKAQKFDKVRVDQLILDVKLTIDKIYPASKIHIDFNLLPETPEKLKVKGNEQLLHLALTNIVGNACKYSRNQPVTISLGATADKIIVAVKDNGIGIPDKELQYIYDPFFRASNTKQFEGYGIGLPLARNIIKIHSGDISVYSSHNQGTTVEIKLPLGNFSV